MNEAIMHVETEVIHGGFSPDKETGATTTPIVQSTSFSHETAEELAHIFEGRAPGYVYSRISNPTVISFERRMTALEQGLGAVACASGMAAISTTALALAGEGDEIVSGNSIFGGTYSLFKNTLSRFGIRPVFVESTDVHAYKDAITDRTKLIFVETIGNPKMDVPDIEAISQVAKEHGVPFVVDSTVTTPVLLRPREFGADIVIHSTSKFVSGHGNAIGGIIIDSGTYDWSNDRYPQLAPFYKKTRQFAFLASLRSLFYRDLGCCLSPFNAFLMLTSIESLAVRMERQCANTHEIALRLSRDKRVEDVRYPGLASHPDNETAERQFSCGYGAVLTLTLGSKQRGFEFINGLRRVQNLANIGDAKTLVIHPASTFCLDATDAERVAMGVSDDMVRLSIGLEHVDDIWLDIDQALDGMTEETTDMKDSKEKEQNSAD
jgi:O-acetylhomoserine (thiol)-lyase